MRPPELARDDTPDTAPVIHAVEWLVRHEGFAPPDLVAAAAAVPLTVSSTRLPWW